MGALKVCKLAVTLTLAAVLTAQVQAARVDLFVFENASSGDVSGLDLWVDVLDVGGTQVDFVFHNDSTVPAIITQIYFESSLSSLVSGLAIQAQTAGVSFKVGAAPGSPPGGNNIGWAGELASFGRTSAGGVSNGVNEPAPVETLTIRGDYEIGADLAAVLAALVGDGRIAQHVQSVGTAGFSVSAVTEGGSGDPQIIVPLPAAVWSGMATLAAMGLGGFAKLRRRA